MVATDAKHHQAKTSSIAHDSLLASDVDESPTTHFPRGHQLIITTTRSISAWDPSGVTNLFKSGSGGIVASKRLASRSSMLAIADDQVVVLHDTRKGQQKSYRLKGSEGRVRLLKYAGNESQDLYFTTTLQNSVQAFSLKHTRLLKTYDTHPSPPAVFAISCDSRLLISTSISPPVIYVRNIEEKTPPMLLKPSCSTSAVVAANFHPERRTIFMLAFANGSVAVYDAASILHVDGIARHLRTGQSGPPVEIASIKRLHTPTTVSMQELEVAFRGHDPATGSVTVTANVAGISSVALLPGHKAMAVTVGSDGKCCIVDFSQPNRKKAVLLKTWHLRRPATCLSVLYTRSMEQQHDGADEMQRPKTQDHCIAVGRQDGKVLLFDLDGTQLGERIIDSRRGRVVDVEWAKVDNGPSRTSRKRSSEAAGNTSDKTDSPSQSSEIASFASNSKMEIPPLFEKGLTRVGTIKKQSSQRSIQGGVKSWATTTSNSGKDLEKSRVGSGPPPIPPRPNWRTDGRRQTRKALKALEAAGHHVRPTIAREMSRGSSRSTRQITRTKSQSARRRSVVAMPKRKVLKGPRAVGTTSSKSSTSNPLSPQPLTAARPSFSSVSNGDSTSPEEARAHVSQVPPPENSSSEETVIDWAAGAPAHQFPGANDPASYFPRSNRPTNSRGKAKTKGHISLSVSSSSMKSPSHTSPALPPEIPQQRPQLPGETRMHAAQELASNPNAQNSVPDAFASTRDGWKSQSNPVLAVVGRPESRPRTPLSPKTYWSLNKDISSDGSLETIESGSSKENLTSKMLLTAAAPDRLINLTRIGTPDDGVTVANGDRQPALRVLNITPRKARSPSASRVNETTVPNATNLLDRPAAGVDSTPKSGTSGTSISAQCSLYTPPSRRESDGRPESPAQTAEQDLRSYLEKEFASLRREIRDGFAAQRVFTETRMKGLGIQHEELAE